jgi:hypothetical protein
MRGRRGYHRTPFLEVQAVQGVCGQGRTGTTSTEFAGEPLMILELSAT